MIYYFRFGLCLLLLACGPDKEQKWIRLFNGKNLDGWIAKFSGSELGENYKNTFYVEDGLLKVGYENYETFDNKFGHLFFKENKFSLYKIRAEFRFTGEQARGAPNWAYKNNGLMLHCQNPESMGINQAFPVCIEVQLLGDDGSGNRPCANPCTPGTHIVLNDSLITEHCPSLSHKTIDDTKWNTIMVEVYGDSLIRHILNDEMVAEYTTPQLDRDDPNTRNIFLGGNLKIDEGYIAIQAESHPTEFRKIELLKMD